MSLSLHAALEGLAVDTWERLRDARRYDIRFGEETITDLLALDLLRMNPPRMDVLPTPKPAEASQGTDWEWWLGSDQSGWLGFAVQAKKVNLKSHRYDNLTHHVGHLK